MFIGRILINSKFLPKFLSINPFSTAAMTKTALLILSEGSEEMEAVISADVLRRAGVKVTIAGLQGSGPLKCSRDVVIVPDTSLEEVQNKEFDVVVLPGGLKGAENFAESNLVKQVLQTQEKKGKLIAAICAAPIALKSHAIGLGKSLTSYPGKKSDLTSGEFNYSEDRVVVDDGLITSRGPGTAFEFALAIVENLLGKDKADALVNPMLLKL